MLDLIRIPSVRRKRRRDSTVSTSVPRLRSSASLPDLNVTNQPLFIPDEAFDLARLRASAKTGLDPQNKTSLSRPNQPRHSSGPLQKGTQLQKDDPKSPFDRIRPVSITSRPCYTLSNTTTGPTPDFFSHQKVRRSFTSERTAETTFLVSEAHRQEMNKLRKASTGRKYVEPLESDPTYTVGPKPHHAYHPLAVQDVSSDFDTRSGSLSDLGASQSVTLTPVFQEGYDVSRDFRVSPSATSVRYTNGSVHGDQAGAQEVSPSFQPSASFATSGSTRSVLDRPRKSMVFHQAQREAETACPERSPGEAKSSEIKPVATHSGSSVKGRRGRDVHGLNLVVCGAKGIGKTSFARLLIGMHRHPGLGAHLPGLLVGEECSGDQSQPVLQDSTLRTLQRCMPTRSFEQHSILLTVDRLASPAPANHEKRLSRYPGKPTQTLHPISIIDTPGLPTADSSMREAAIAGLERLIEGRMADRLNRELQVDRSINRSGRHDDQLIHLMLYLIDPGAVLSRAEASSSNPPVFDFVDETASKAADAWKPQLRQEDVAAISRLSCRTSVLPMIAKVDTLTAQERAVVKQAVWRDLLAAGLRDSLAVFEELGDHQLSDRQEMRSLHSTGSPSEMLNNQDEVYPDSGTGFGNDTLPRILPVFSANPELALSQNSEPTSVAQHMSLSCGLSRKYAWGDINVLDARITDTAALYASLLSKTFIATLVDRSREELYEDYRTERLALIR